MFAKLRSSSVTPVSPLENNPIGQFFEIGKQVACAGPELVWKIHDAYRKSDGKVRKNYLPVVAVGWSTMVIADGIRERCAICILRFKHAQM